MSKAKWLPMTMVLVMGSLLNVPQTARGQQTAAKEIEWRLNYNKARQEARETGKPIFMDFSTQACFHCKRLDGTTFRDPVIIEYVNSNFIPLKLDGNRHETLVKALNINGFPTLVFASSQGKVLSIYPGYVDAAGFRQRMNTVMALLEKEKNIANSNPVQLTSATKKSSNLLGDRNALAKKMLAQAKEELQTGQYICCLVHCKIIAANFADLPESASARQLIMQLKSDSQTLQTTCERLADSLCELYLELAQSWLTKGQNEKARPYLEWIVQSCPNTPHAAGARQALTQMDSVPSSESPSLPPTPPAAPPIPPAPK